MDGSPDFFKVFYVTDNEMKNLIRWKLSVFGESKLDKTSNAKEMSPQLSIKTIRIERGTLYSKIPYEYDALSTAPVIHST